jgi:hypothetical protein
MDGDAWPPFFEMPFARSGGDDLAWDGLSKYDLTKYNHWYFDRLKQFADLCDQNGLVLFNNHFFQHNILEAGAHWSSSPWRSANNINDMGFPEPPNYAGDKRIFMAEQFYDVTHPTRTKIYRDYIRKCLDNFTTNSNVVHLISAEYSGPLHFTQFWIDTIAQWERETGKSALIGLGAPKDVQDAILADPARAAVVDVIYIRYWHYQPDGSVHSPEGGKNVAPRQWDRLFGPRAAPFEQAVRAVREYREKFPDKAVVYAPWNDSAQGWASLMGGGSLPQITTPLDPKLLQALPAMKPLDLPTEERGKFALTDAAGTNYLVSGGEWLPRGVNRDDYISQRMNTGNDSSITWYSRKK